MGYDVSFHPVDAAFIEHQVVPIILGEKDPTELYEKAAIAARSRFHTNAWGLGVVQFQHAQLQAEREAPKKGAIARLFSRDKDTGINTLPDFESDLYVWGRPYFVSSDGDALYAAIDSYSAATPEEADAIARGMIKARWPDIADKVQKDNSSGEPSMEDFLYGTTWKIELFREAVQAYRDGTKVRLPEGEELDPIELLGDEAQMAILEFCSVLTPGWMGRGRVAPTQLYQEVEKESEFIESSAAPFEGLRKALPGLSLKSDMTINENFMVGGYVAPENVVAFRDEFESVTKELHSNIDDEGWRQEFELVTQKINEALTDAARRGVGFVEASEIYSGSMGMMN